MKRFAAFLLAAGMALAFAACGTPDGNDTPSPARREALPGAEEPAAAADDPEAEISIVLSVGDRSFSATLLNNKTTAALTERLPLTLDMSELNGNEKYFYLDDGLPTDPCKPGQINAGDLMLYGDNCLVLFYESFSSGYSYTRLGSVDDPSGLAAALGRGSVEASFRAD